MRALVLGLTVVAVLLSGGCNSQVPLDAQPHDQNSGRDLARTIAKYAHCDDASFEDYNITSKDHWEFTCQKSNQMFLIHTDANPTTKASMINKLATSKEPHKSGPFFVVYEFRTEGHVNTLADLQDFPGDPGPHS
jgi:hypothetical protein